VVFRYGVLFLWEAWLPDGIQPLVRRCGCFGMCTGDAKSWNFLIWSGAGPQARQLLEWQDKADPSSPHEATKLNLATDKAFHTLGWQPRWNFETTIARTASWFREATGLRSAPEVQALTRRQIDEYQAR